MYFKKLVCASDIPSIRETLSGKNYPFLFNNNSPSDFIEKIEDIISLNNYEAPQIVESNFKKLSTDYSENNFNELSRLLKK